MTVQYANSNEDTALALMDQFARQYQRRVLIAMAILIPLVSACCFAAGWVSRGIPY